MPTEYCAEELRIKKAALDYARQHKKEIAKRLTRKTRFPSEKEPVAIFMAGSPGAGKTESSKELVDFVEQPILRIDPDELREEFPNYNGRNAYLFQGGVSIVVSRLLDFAFKQKQSFLLDGTLSKYEAANDNVSRALNHNRSVLILYVYQRPKLAWKFTQAREALEGRRIDKHTFIKEYFESQRVVQGLKQKFGTKIQVDILIKYFDNTTRSFRANVDNITDHIPERITPAELHERLRGL